MANRRDYFHGQLLTEGELDAGFDGLEQADWNQAVDWSATGIIAGITVAESAPPALTVEVAIGTAYSKAGKRIRVDQSTTVDVSVDEDAVSTAVVGGANERWITIYAEFARALSDPRIDDNGGAVNFIQNESFSLFVRQGAEAGAGLATKPALDSSALVLCDILLTNGKATILNADLNTDRREAFSIYTADQLGFDDTGLVVVLGATVDAALSAIDAELASRGTQLDNHVAGSAQRHTAAMIDTSVGSWDRLTGATSQAAFDEIDTDLYGLEQYLAFQIPSLLLDGGAPTDGGGLTLDVAAAKFVSGGSAFVTSATSIAVGDDDETWVYFTSSGVLGSSTLPGAIPNSGVPIAKVTAAGGSISVIDDLRIERDNESYDFVVRVGNNNSCHFTKLSTAVDVLKLWRSIYSEIRFTIELVGTVAEAEADLPIVLDSGGWTIRGMDGHRLDYGGGADTLGVNLFNIAANDILIEGLRIRISTSVEPNAADHDRVVFYGTAADRVTIRDCRLETFDKGAHGFVLFDSATDCNDWTVERCFSDDLRDFGIYAPSPNTGGQGVAVRLSVRDCIFTELTGARHSPSIGLNFEEGRRILIQNTQVDGFDGGGMNIGSVDSAVDVRIEGCTVTGGNVDGIYLDTNATRCWVEGCYIAVSGAAADGIVVEGDRNFVTRNNIASTANLGLLSAAGAGNIFAHNQSNGAGNSIAAGNTDDNNRNDV